MTDSHEAPEPTLRTYLAVLDRRKRWVVPVTVLGWVSALGYPLTQPKAYSASTQLLVQPIDPCITSGGTSQPITPTDVLTELQLVTPATAPSSPKPSRDAILGLMLGLLLGIGAAFSVLVKSLDDTVRLKEELERLADGRPVLGLAPMVGSWQDRQQRPVMSQMAPSPVDGGAYPAQVVDGTVLVAVGGQASGKNLRRATEARSLVTANVVGLVLNEVTSSTGYGCGYGCGYDKGYFSGGSATVVESSNGNGNGVHAVAASAVGSGSRPADHSVPPTGAQGTG